MVVPDGASERSGLSDELGSEEDLLYEEFRGSGHRFGHPGGGGGEQLAINEVGNIKMLSLPLNDFATVSFFSSTRGISGLLMVSGLNFMD